MRVVLVSTYDLGRQPFGLASPAAWLREAGHDVSCIDLALDEPDQALIRGADAVAFFVPMHTATRLAAALIPWVRQVNPCARLCCYGLYASLNAEYLLRLGADAVMGGEFEPALVAFMAPAAVPARTISMSHERLAFRVPDRSGLPPLSRYARLELPDGTARRVGATEASRGCKHQCRHCPIVPVYGGRFRVIPIDVVLEDVRRLVEAGAEHITFGDPDFWNAIGHAVPLVRRLHAEFPRLSYDVTIKIEHLLRHRERLDTLRGTGCVLVTSAVESLDDAVLTRLDKGHTRSDVIEVVGLCREHGLALSPTFIPFTPWTARAGVLDLLNTLETLDLVEHVAPVQLGIRLLVPAGSKLLDLEEIRAVVRPFDERLLVHPWAHPDPDLDRLQRDVMACVGARSRAATPRQELFDRVRELARGVTRSSAGTRSEAAGFRIAPVPYLTEPWYC